MKTSERICNIVNVAGSALIVVMGLVLIYMGANLLGIFVALYGCALFYWSAVEMNRTMQPQVSSEEVVA